MGENECPENSYFGSIFNCVVRRGGLGRHHTGITSICGLWEQAQLLLIFRRNATRQAFWKKSSRGMCKTFLYTSSQNTLAFDLLKAVFTDVFRQEYLYNAVRQVQSVATAQETRRVTPTHTKPIFSGAPIQWLQAVCGQVIVQRCCSLIRL